MPKYLVETIDFFRMRYVVECDSLEHAKDAVTMKEVEEFGQLHIDEAIVGCREISDEEIPTLFFEDHPYLQEWGPSKAFEYVHKVKDNGTE
jgi:hypothetical protein